MDTDEVWNMRQGKALRTVVIRLTTERLKENVEILAATLRSEGVEVLTELPDTGQGADCVRQEPGSRNGDSAWREPDGILYLTDDVNQLRIWQKCGLEGAVLLHEGNRLEDFQGIMYALERVEELDRGELERIYRRLHGLPWRILETDRCVVREITVEDVDRLYEIYAEPSVTEYMDNLYADREEEKSYTQSYIRNMYGFYGYGMWIVEVKYSGRVIGRVGIEPCGEENELGYVIAEPWRRLGIAYEVCRAVMKYGFEELGLDQISARVQRENQPSKGLLQKLGFQKHSETAESDAIMEKWICRKDFFDFLQKTL